MYLRIEMADRDGLLHLNRVWVDGEEVGHQITHISVSLTGNSSEVTVDFDWDSGISTHHENVTVDIWKVTSGQQRFVW